MARNFRKAIAATALGVLVLAGATVPVLAKERQTMLQGVTACKATCDRINRMIPSQHRCYVACERYWMCNGSDSTATTCADKPAVDARVDGGAGPHPPAQPQGPALAPRRPTASPN
jgi:hypothetical protein